MPCPSPWATLPTNDHAMARDGRRAQRRSVLAPMRRYSPIGVERVADSCFPHKPGMRLPAWTGLEKGPLLRAASATRKRQDPKYCVPRCRQIHP